MRKQNSNGEVEIRVQPRFGDNAVRPLEVSPSAATVAAVAQPPPQRRRPPSPPRRPRRRWAPWLVPAIVAANVVVFAVTMSVNDCPRRSSSCVARFLGRFSFQPIKENPLLGPSSSTLEKMGALDVNKVVKEHQGWRLITCIWLHAGVVHILANMISLLLIGIRLEQEFGFVKIGLLYMISGLGGSLLSALFIQSNISVGASGALFGLLGAMLSELIMNWTIYANKVYIKMYRFTVGLVMLFRGVNGNDHCSWCHYLSCVPTKKWSCNSSPTYCTSSQNGNTLNLTCEGNGRSNSYLMPNATDAQIKDLCTQLCS